jgi:hypothetical protein
VRIAVMMKLAGDVFLTFTFCGELVVAGQLANDFLDLSHHDVLPRRRRLPRVVVWLSHQLSLVREDGCRGRRRPATDRPARPARDLPQI